MFETETLIWFCVASLALLVIPGPAVFYILARSIEQGRVAGVVSVLGVSTASLMHIAAAALGLSALVLSSATLFSVVKYLGAAYLVYLGVRAFLGGDPAVAGSSAGSASLRRIFVQGLVVNLLNPKTALFFLAFLPQFVNPAAGNVALQFVVLGSIFVVLGIISDGVYALLAGGVGEWLKTGGRMRAFRRWFSGSVFVSLGVFAGLTDPATE